MSRVSKGSAEERERLREQAKLMEIHGVGPTQARELPGILWDLLDALDAKELQDERIAELDKENQRIAELVSEVYLEITDGEISKPSTDPTVVLDYARESNERDNAEDLRRKDERIAELEAEQKRQREQLNYIESYCEDYAHDITTSHKAMRAICKEVGVEQGPER